MLYVVYAATVVVGRVVRIRSLRKEYGRNVDPDCQTYPPLPLGAAAAAGPVELPLYNDIIQQNAAGIFPHHQPAPSHPESSGEVVNPSAAESNDDGLKQDHHRLERIDSVLEEIAWRFPPHHGSSSSPLSLFRFDPRNDDDANNQHHHHHHHRLERIDSVLEEIVWRMPPHHDYRFTDCERLQPCDTEDDDSDVDFYAADPSGLSNSSSFGSIVFQFRSIKRHASKLRRTLVNWDYFTEFWRNVRAFSWKQWAESSTVGKLMLLLRVGCGQLASFLSSLLLLLSVAPTVFLLKLTVPVVDTEMDNSNWSQPVTAFHCIVSPLMTLIAVKEERVMIGGIVPIWSIVLVVGCSMAITLILTTRRDIAPKCHTFLAYVGFMMAICWIYCLAREVVGVVTLLGTLTGVSHDILGLTLLAWSNSIGDLVTDITVARQGASRMALSACIGGPLFNLLLGIGISFTIATARNGGAPIPIEFSNVTKVLIGFLAWSLLSSLILIPAARFRATRLYAGYLLVVYGLFLVTVLLAERGVF